MFKQLSSISKAGLFYGIALSLILLLAWLGQGLGWVILAVAIFTPLAAVLLIYPLQKQRGAEPMALSALEAQ